jgi:hypothetical protein
MELTADLTKKDYAAFRRYAMFRFRKVWLVYVLLGVYVGWTSFPGADPEQGLSLSSGVIAAVLLGLMAAGVTAIVAWLLMAILPNRPGAVVGKHVFTLTDSEFQEKNAIGAMTVRLDVLQRHETAKHVFLITPTHVAFVVPKRALEGAPEFLRLLVERTKHLSQKASPRQQRKTNG